MTFRSQCSAAYVSFFFCTPAKTLSNKSSALVPSCNNIDTSFPVPSYLFTSQVKIQGQNKEMLATACQMFMGKSEPEISHIALETLEGHQRAIIAHLTVEVMLRFRIVGTSADHPLGRVTKMRLSSAAGDLPGPQEVFGAGLQGGLLGPCQHGDWSGQLHPQRCPR